ncbi:MAG: hypothetical protein ACYC27_01390 [Armatimonadota bacterium]
MTQRILRPMDYGAMLDELFDIYKKNFLLLTGITGIVHLPLSMLFYSLYMPMVLKLTTNQMPEIADIVALALVLLLYMPLSYMVIASITWAISKSYLGYRTTIAESYKAIASKLIPFMLTMLLVSVIYGLGFVLFCVPGIVMMINIPIAGAILFIIGIILYLILFAFLAIILAFVGQIFIIEDKQYIVAIKRSYELSKKEWLKIFVVGLLTTLVVSTITGALTSPFQIMQAFSKAPMTGGWAVAQGFANGVAQALALPISSISFVLLYYDIRIRKEGFDLEMLAQNMNDEKSPDAITKA